MQGDRPDAERPPAGGPPPAPRGLTRRALIAGAAGAAGLARPVAGADSARSAPRSAAASVARRPPGVLAVDLGTLPAGVVREAPAAGAFDLVAVQWTGDRGAHVLVRTRRGAQWSPWADASARGHEAPAGERAGGAAGPIGEPVWTGPADGVQVIASQRLRRVRVHLVDGGWSAAAGAPPAGEAALALAQPILDAGPGQPPIIARSAWGRGLTPRGAPQYGAVRMAFVHHTESQNGYAASEVAAGLRAIYAFHRFVRGWKDIGYNFVIDRFGRIWEARAGGIDEPVAGAQTGGFNGVSTGVAMLGSFSGVPVSAAAHRALVALLAWKLSLHGLPARGRAAVEVDPFDRSTSLWPAGTHVSLPRIAGHRDADSTDCPGAALYGELAGVRRQAAVAAGRPVRLDLSAPAGATAAGFAISGRAAFLDGAPLAGVPIAIQARQAPGAGARELTLAQAVTDPAGAFTAQVPAARDVSLRALHVADAAGPASVSAPVDVVVAPALTLQAAQASPGAPLQASGTVLPAKARVRLRVAAVSADGTVRRVRELAVAGAGGSFAATVALPGPGRYRVQAATASDARNGAGASAPVDVLAG